MSRFGVIEVDKGGGGSNGNGKPTEGEQTGRQHAGSPISCGHSILGGSGFDGATTGFGLLEAYAGQINSSTAMPGSNPHLWHQLYGETYGTYRLMRTQPTIAVGRAIVMTPLISATFDVEAAREGVPDAWVNYARAEVLPAFINAIPEALRSLDFGHYKFEQVWRYVRGFWGIERLKPLAVDANLIILEAVTGKFMGIRPIGTFGSSGNNTDLGPLKACVFTHDGEAGDLRGRSRFENFRSTAWADWIKTIIKLDRLREKLSGIIPIFYHPAGEFEEPAGSGNYVSYQKAAQDAAEALIRGDYVTIETLNWKSADLRQNPDLAKLGLSQVQFYEAGDYAPAQLGMLANLEYDDRCMMRGMLRPERVALEVRGGSGGRADAEQHSDTGTLEGQALGVELLCKQGSTGVLNDGLVVNFGEDARDAVRFTMSPLVTAQAARNERIITALIANGVAPDIAASLDVQKMLETMDAPTTAAFALTLYKAQQKQQQQPPGDGGNPKQPPALPAPAGG